MGQFFSAVICSVGTRHRLGRLLCLQKFSNWICSICNLTDLRLQSRQTFPILSYFWLFSRQKFSISKHSKVQARNFETGRLKKCNQRFGIQTFDASSTFFKKRAILKLRSEH